MRGKNIVITTGGTGGHVFPAKALSEYILDQQEENNITILLDKRAYKNNYKWDKSIKVYQISSLGMHKKNIIFLLKMMFFIGIGILQTLSVFIKAKPNVLVSFGGYSSIPAVVSAIILRIPIIMHEQNAVLGKAHRMFIKYAKIVALTFEDTKNIPSGTEVEVVGLPLRKDFYNRVPQDKAKDKLVILVLGGSQGSSVFGNTIAKAFSLLSIQQQENIKIYHQCRKELLKQVIKIWDTTKVEYIIQPFFHDIASIMEESDLIIARSGSSTIAEINALNKKALYIPFAKAAEHHQELNARNEEKYSGADVILEKNFNANSLSEYINTYKGDGKKNNNRKIISAELLYSLVKKIIK